MFLDLLVLWVIQFPSYSFIGLLVLSFPVVLLQYHWALDCRLFNCIATRSLTFGLYVLQLPCCEILELWFVSYSVALLQCHWSLGGKFFNCFATVALSLGRSVLQLLIFGLSVYQLLCYILFGFGDVSSSIALLQRSWPLGCKLFNDAATIPLTLGL